MSENQSALPPRDAPSKEVRSGSTSVPFGPAYIAMALGCLAFMQRHTAPGQAIAICLAATSFAVALYGFRRGLVAAVADRQGRASECRPLLQREVSADLSILWHAAIVATWILIPLALYVGF